MSDFLDKSDSGKRPIYLACFREPGRFQRQHFAIFVPYLAKPHRGTLIHVTGGPTRGYTVEFKRNSEPETWPEEGRRCEAIIPIGEFDFYHFVDWTRRGVYEDSVPTKNLERAALWIEAPRASESLNAPVNDTTNRRSQEWTVDYVRHLYDLNYLTESAVAKVEQQRDPPRYGINIIAPRPVGS